MATIEMERVIDLQREQPLSLNQARKHLPGQPVHCTVYRWAVQGINGVKLPTVRIGRRRFTSLSAIQWFVDRLAQQEES